MHRRPVRLWLLLALLAAAPGRPELVLTGRVEIEGGAPLPGAAIQLLSARPAHARGLDELAGRHQPEPLTGAVTGVDGGFELRAPEPGLWVARAAADGFVPMDFLLWPLVEDTVLPTVTLRTDRPTAVTVRGPDGAPVAGALVVASSQSPWLWRPPHPTPTFWRPAQRREATDADGVATLPRADGETLEVRGFRPGFDAAPPTETSAAAVTLSLRAGREVAVRVEDAGGRPAADALVLVGREGWAAGVTDAGGLLETVLPEAGPVRALTAGGARAAASVPADADRVELELIEPTLVTGRVVDAESRRPLAGALVWSGRRTDSFARTDRDGRFSLRADAGASGVFSYLQAAATGYFTEGARLAEDREHEPVLALRAAAAAAGQVVDARGEPVAGAEVTAMPIPDSRSASRAVYRQRGARARSGEDGQFRLGGLMPGLALRLVATRDGYAPAELEVAPLEPRTTRSDLRLTLTRGARLSGRLLGAGEPVAGAELTLVREPEGSSPYAFMAGELYNRPLAGTSGDDGTFEYRHLVPARYRLEVTAPGFAPLTAPGVRVDEAEAGTDLGTLELEPGVEITGLVVDGDGRPVAGAEVRAASPEPGIRFMMRSGGESEEPAAVTDAGGRFVVPDRRAGERVDLHASHPDYTSATAPGVEAPNARPVQIVLERAARIAGRVLDPGGAPIPFAIVMVESAEGGRIGAGRGFARVRSQPRARSDESGGFEIEGVPPGKIRVTAIAQGWQTAELSDLEVAVGASLEDLQLVLQRGATVTGQVLAADGLPVIGVTVMVEQQQTTMRMSMPAMATTDGDGRYLLEGVEPGPRTIVAQSQELGRTAKDLDVAPRVNRLDLRFTGGVEVSGQVVDAAGSPVGGATVSMLATDRDWAGAEAQTGEDGGFTIAGVRDGQYTLRVNRAGYATHAGAEPVLVAGAPVSGLEVRLEAGGAIAGRLLGLEPAELARVQVMAALRQSRWAAGQVSHDGTYRVPDLAPGEWHVQALLDGGRQASGRVTLDPGAAEAILDLDFASGLVLTGQVLRSGQPLAGLGIQVRGLDSYQWAGSRTDHEGRFRVEGLESGRYRLEVADPLSGFSHSEEVNLDGDRDVLVEIATERVAGQVLDARDLSPVAGAVVSLEPLTEASEPRVFGRPPGSGSDAQGRFLIAEVAAGDYRLQVVKDGYAPAERSLAVVPGAALDDLEVLLEATRGLTLLVRMPSGAPATEVYYGVLDASDRPLTLGSRPADETGRVRLPSVPAGTFDVVVSAPGAASRRLRVEVPGPEVPVGLQPSCRLEVAVAALAGDDAQARLRITAPDGRPFIYLFRGGLVRSEWQLYLGETTIEGLAPGGYAVEVTAPDGRAWQSVVTVSAGRLNRLDL